MERVTEEKLGREQMLRALIERDSSWDGLFFAGITSTMVFCRPSCPARKPRPEHVQFFASAREALLAGFRPCRRCRPLEEARVTPEWVSRLIDQVEANPRLRIRDADLRAQGLEPAAVRRYFQKAYGMSFQAYSRARRLGQAFAAIREGASIDDAVFDHGWESHSGFREAFSRAAESAPGAARGREFIRLAWLETPLGPMAAGATDGAICLLEFTDRRMLQAQLSSLKARFSMPVLPGESPLLERLRGELAEYFAGGRRSFQLPVAYPGTPFQQRVWDALRRIPYGETRSYAELARELGSPGAARAVGQANGLNRIAILIPCHRVINADGSLGGYGGGLWRKLRLLETEGALPGGARAAGHRPGARGPSEGTRGPWGGVRRLPEGPGQ
ncbi:MAG: bifunctional transcriptional activator/DNA repair protein Ada [Spirochaetales bacterium]|nr:bifunctional transcriptional activator/DNA repair protein Ada [Spirochaetales bacterium]